MKKSYITLSLLALFMLLFSTEIKAQDSLEIEGVIYHSSAQVNNIDAKVYIDNTLFKNIQLHDNNKLITNIPLGEIVTVEFNAPGYYVKRIMFDTHVPPDYKKKSLYYKFDVDLYSEDEIQDINISGLDFPIGLVKYNKNKFDENTPYTRRKKSEHIDMLKKTKRTSSGK